MLWGGTPSVRRYPLVFNLSYAQDSPDSSTLYDLIAAIQDGLSPDDDTLVVATVVHLLRSGRLTWRGKAREHLGQSRRAAMWVTPRISPRTTVEQSWSQGQH